MKLVEINVELLYLQNIKSKKMKKIITILLLIATLGAFSQAFIGKGDMKGQVGFSTQKYGSGLNLTFDQGVGENISLGLSTVYLLSTDANINGMNYALKFKDQFDLKARFNANIGNVLKLPSNMDIYPGLNIGTRNFGAHFGFRYFFTEGFGVYTESSFPISKFDKNATDFNNQFVFNIGASFNL